MLVVMVSQTSFVPLYQWGYVVQLSRDMPADMGPVRPHLLTIFINLEVVNFSRSSLDLSHI